MARHKDANWILPELAPSEGQAQIAVLMDIRDELKRLNALLHCENFQAIPNLLRAIEPNTKKKPRARRLKREK